MSCDYLLVVISVYLCQTEGYESLWGFYQNKKTHVLRPKLKLWQQNCVYHK